MHAQGLLNKQPKARLGWPALLQHPFVREGAQEAAAREAAAAEAARQAEESRGWRGEAAGKGITLNPKIHNNFNP